MNSVLVSQPKVAETLAVCVKTLRNWRCDPAMKFPEPVLIRSRVYFKRNEIEDFITRAANRGN